MAVFMDTIKIAAVFCSLYVRWEHALSQVCLRQSNTSAMKWTELNVCGVSIKERDEQKGNQWKAVRERERDERRGRALRSVAVYGSKWQTNGTAIWQEFSLLLPTFNRPWHEHDACPSGVAATFSSSICFMARNGDTVQPLVITAASYQPGSPGSQPASCQLAGTGGRTRYKIQNCSSLVERRSGAGEGTSRSRQATGLS